MARVANTINDRPLGIRQFGGAEGDLLPITPNLLLHTRTETGNIIDDRYEESPDKYTKRMKFMEEVLDFWWSMWYSQVFSSLVPFKKWKRIEENVSVGDIVMVRYEHKVKRADYRLGRVKSVEEASRGWFARCGS